VKFDQPRRRDFIALVGSIVVAPWPMPVTAQQRPATPVVGLLSFGSPEAGAPFFAALLDGLKEGGFVDGRNVSVTSRWAQGRRERLSALASELVALNVDVLVASSPYAAVAARDATRTIPIVFMATDPVALGLVASYNRPGGNLTGITGLNDTLIPKRLELLRELMPKATSLVLLINPENPNAVSQLSDALAAARSSGHTVQALEARTESEIGSAFARLVERRVDALVVVGDAFFVSQRDQIVALAARNALPAIYDTPDFAAAGGLISYGSNLRDSIRLTGVYASKILAGARPADLPVQQPTRFELVINLKTAKALGIEIPPTLLARADRVIE